MHKFFEEVNLNYEHINFIIKGMYHLAKNDGLSKAEKYLIEEFYGICKDEISESKSIDDIIKENFDFDASKEILNTDELKKLFMKSCILLAYSDGNYSSEKEGTLIKEYALKLNIDDEELKKLHQEVKDFLMSQFTNIANVEALKEVENKLK